MITKEEMIKDIAKRKAELFDIIRQQDILAAVRQQKTSELMSIERKLQNMPNTPKTENKDVDKDIFKKDGKQA